MTAVGSAAVQDRAVQRALAQLQPSDRAIQAVWGGVPGQSNLNYAQLNRIARAATAPILGQKPFGVLVFREATWGGAFVNLGAVDGLAKWLDLEAGRAAAPLHAVELRADPDRRCARRAEAAVPARRRPRGVPPWRAPLRVLRRGRRQAPADPRSPTASCRSTMRRSPMRP